MLSKPDSLEFPYEPTLKKATSWGWAIAWAKALDSMFSYVLDNAIPKPIIVENVESTGEFQTVNLAKPLSAAPSLVRVVVREPPTVKVAMETVVAAYRVEYGTHSATSVSVRVGHSTGATKAKFDVWIWV